VKREEGRKGKERERRKEKQRNGNGSSPSFSTGKNLLRYDWESTTPRATDAPFCFFSWLEREWGRRLDSTLIDFLKEINLTSEKHEELKQFENELKYVVDEKKKGKFEKHD